MATPQVSAKLVPSARTAKRHWLNEGQATYVVILRRRGDRVTVRTDSGAVFTVSSEELS